MYLQESIKKYGLRSLKLPRDVEIGKHIRCITFDRKNSQRLPGRDVCKRCVLKRNYIEFSNKPKSLGSRPVDYTKEFRLKSHVGGMVCRITLDGTYADLQTTLNKYWG